MLVPLLVNADPWAQVISRVSPSVVSLQVSQVRDFEDGDQGVGAATGFVVDAEQGIILTNRHVVGAGPIRAIATFQNQEKVDVVPLYRDPIHDFGFMRYNPSDLKYLQPKSLSLVPQKVETGMNIRVIGSDGGEQLSILAGTIARLDRRAPNYGRYEYNDFNTFYFQAASSTSGGSSGSPVLDKDGDVVALNAAANSRTASSFFLPIDRIKRALELLQKDMDIPRGTLKTVFEHRSFRDLRRLGLDEDIESEVRTEKSNATGMLTISQVMPGSSVYKLLKEGDILISLNHQFVADFITLEAFLDTQVEKEIIVEVIRQGELIKLRAVVSDLHLLIPDRLLEMGDSILQDMSLHHVRGMNLPSKGVVLAKNGFMFQQAGLPEDALIIAINAEAVNSLDDIIRLLTTGTTKEWLIRYVIQGREFSSEVSELTLDNEWFRYRICDRKDDQRFWDCDPITLSKFEESKPEIQPTIPRFENPLMQKIAPAMVRVDFHIPYKVDNVYSQHYSGTGLVVDAENGLISIDRNTVPISMGNVMVTFFGSYEVPAEVVFLNPLHNLAIIKYDPEKLKGVSIPAVKLANPQQVLPQNLFRIANRDDGTYRINRLGNANRVTVSLEDPRVPRFQQTPVDVFTVSNMPPSLGGPIVDESGQIHALWMSFAYEEGKEIKEVEWAMPIRILADTLRSYRNNGVYYSLDLRMHYQSLSRAIRMGLDNNWLQKYLQQPAEQRRVLYIEQTVHGTSAAGSLQPGDILLSIDGELVTDLLDAESLGQKPDVTIEVLRERKVQSINLHTSALTGVGSERFVSWAGAIFQEPHREVAYYEGIEVPGVYIAATESGSPAILDHLYRNRFVTEVDGVAVRNLDEFLEKVKTIKQDEFTRLTVISLSGRRDIISVSPDFYFWPTFEIAKNNGDWQRTEY